MDKNLPVGVIDSGVGGLSVLKVLQKMLPHEDFLYIGDTARTPYGQRTEAEIRAFVREMTDYLNNAGIKLLVIACNTITVLGTESIKNGYGFDVVGMSKGAELALGTTKNKKIGVMATPFTVASGAHKAAVNVLDADAEVFAQGCPAFVPLVESGVFDGEPVAKAIAEYAAPLKAAGVDVVLLSCTHFPFIRPAIEAEFGEGVTVLDPAEATALQSRLYLERAGLLKLRGTGHADVCFTAELERAKAIAEHMLDMDRCSFRQISLK